MTRQEITDLYFLDARHKLIEIAAFLDRVQRAPGTDDYRVASFRRALKILGSRQPGRARRVLEAFSDRTRRPSVRAQGTAKGAGPGKVES